MKRVEVNSTPTRDFSVAVRVVLKGLKDLSHFYPVAEATRHMLVVNHWATLSKEENKVILTPIYRGKNLIF